MRSCQQRVNFRVLPVGVRVAEWSKAPDSSSGPRMWAWVQIPLLTKNFCPPLRLGNHSQLLVYTILCCCPMNKLGDALHKLLGIHAAAELMLMVSIASGRAETSFPSKWGPNSCLDQVCNGSPCISLVPALPVPIQLAKMVRRFHASIKAVSLLWKMRMLQRTINHVFMRLCQHARISFHQVTYPLHRV